MIFRAEDRGQRWVKATLILLLSLFTALCDFLMRISLQAASRGEGRYGRFTLLHTSALRVSRNCVVSCLNVSGVDVRKRPK